MNRTAGYRVSSAGLPPIAQLHKTSVQLKLILLPGETRPLSAPGWTFYVIAASRELFIRPDTGSENPYTSGTGLDLDQSNAFTTLQVRNPSVTEAAYIDIFIGFDSYIDKRLIYPSIYFKRILRSVYNYVDAGAPAADIAVPDLSGTVITDLNGDEFFALERLLLICFNGHATDGLYISSGGDEVVPIFGQTGIQLPLTGDLEVTAAGGGGLPMISEVYNCVPNPA